MTEDWSRTKARVRLQTLVARGLSVHCIFAAVQLGVFDLLDRDGPLSASEVAGRIDADAGATRRLLGALVATGLVKRDGDRFGADPVTGDLLVRGRPGSLAGWVETMQGFERGLHDLAESVRGGSSAGSPDAHLGESAQQTRAFVHGMHDYATGSGEELVRHIDLAGRRRLLDVGGGPGTYAMLLAQANPGLQCTVFDLAPVGDVAREIVAGAGLADRVEIVAGDYHTDDLPAGFDAVLVSNVLHQEGEDGCSRLLAKCHRALDAGGILMVQGMFLDENNDGPLWPSVLDILMLTLYPGGRAYTAGETASMVREAGFVDVDLVTLPVLTAGGLITATRR